MFGILEIVVMVETAFSNFRLLSGVNPL